MKQSFILLYLAASIFITGCQSRTLHPGGGCWRNRDCNDPELLCITSKCMNLACQQEGDCPFGYVCTEKGQDNICKQASCSTEVDCPDGLICNESGYCIEGPLPNGSACTAAEDCASEQCISDLCCESACAEGTCNESGECIIPCEPECSENQSCVDGECVADADNCDPNPCQNSGTCTDTGETYTCACATGWEGSTCTSATTGACSPNPCQNSGACADTGTGTYECTCDNSWTGTNCDTADNDCSPNPCQNSGVCADTGTGTYECTCVGDWTGTNCDTADNDCSPNPCQNSGTCEDTGIGTYECTCDTGWTGTNCDTASGGTKADGESCAAGTQCVSGHCADDVCCENACSDELSGSCNGSGTEGQCVQDLGTVCSDAADCQSPYCDGLGIDGATTGFCCAQTACPEGQDCNNSSGVCGNTTGQSCTDDGQCSTGNCVDSTCCVDAACDAGSGCTTGTCLKNDGEACSNNGSECLSGACAWADSTGNSVGDTYLCCEGACTSGTCDVDGVCVCSNGPCAGNQTCQIDTGYCGCIPDCTGKVCGEDGCGTEACGTCTDPATCHENRCIGPGAPASNVPDGIGCNNMHDCTNSTKPNCIESTCGPVAESCAWLKTNHLARDGVYWIDVEGTPTRVYCDMQLAKVICSEAGVTEHVGKTRAARAGGADTTTYPEYDDMDYRMQNILNPDTGHCVAWRFQHTDPNDGRPLARIDAWSPTDGNPARDESAGNELDTCEALGFLDNHEIDDCNYGPGGTSCGFSSGCTGTAGESDFYCDFYGNTCPNPSYNNCSAEEPGYEYNVNNQGMTASYRALGPVGPVTTGFVNLPGNFSGGARAYCLAQINSTVNDGRFDTVEKVHYQTSADTPYGGTITALGPEGKSRWWAVGPVKQTPSIFTGRVSAVKEATPDEPNNLHLKMELLTESSINSGHFSYVVAAQPICVPDFDCGTDTICGNSDDPDTLKLRFRWRWEQNSTSNWTGTLGSMVWWNIVKPGHPWPTGGVEALDFTAWEFNDGSAWDSEAYGHIVYQGGNAANTEWVENTYETGYSYDDGGSLVPLTDALSIYKGCLTPVLLEFVVRRYRTGTNHYTHFFVDDVQFYIEHNKDGSVP